MAGSFADSPRNGAWGDRPYSIIDWPGPASYTQVTAGSAGPPLVPPTGGQAINAAAFGLGSPLEGIFSVGLSSTGTYRVYALQLTSYNLGNGNATWALMWITAATGAQVSAAVNLSGENVRLIGFGPY